MRSSYSFKHIPVVFNISSRWVRKRLLTNNQLPRFPESGLKCNHIRCGGGVVVVVRRCGDGGVVVLLPIIIPHQPSCFVSGCWLGCDNTLEMKFKIHLKNFHYTLLITSSEFVDLVSAQMFDLKS